VIDPKGAVVARGGGNEEIIYVEVDPELSEKWREKFPALKDIRLR
jgi:predicted amidohydrolase